MDFVSGRRGRRRRCVFQSPQSVQVQQAEAVEQMDVPLQHPASQSRRADFPFPSPASARAARRLRWSHPDCGNVSFYLSYPTALILDAGVRMCPASAANQIRADRFVRRLDEWRKWTGPSTPIKWCLEHNSEYWELFLWVVVWVEIHRLDQNSIDGTDGTITWGSERQIWSKWWLGRFLTYIFVLVILLEFSEEHFFFLFQIVIILWIRTEPVRVNFRERLRLERDWKWDGDKCLVIKASIWQPEIITKRGYAVEIHSVTTKDGYILELHRIPPSRGANATRIVFLQHGLLDSSAAWVINPTNRSLGDYWTATFFWCYIVRTPGIVADGWCDCVSNSFPTGRWGLWCVAGQRSR